MRYPIPLSSGRFLLFLAGSLLLGSLTRLSAQSLSDSSPQVLHRSSRLVVVNVVVTDTNQKPVRGLKATDFTITDNKRPQTIRYFEEQDTSSNPQPPEPTTDPPNVVTNMNVVPAEGAVTVLLVDTLNTPLDSQPYLRSELLSFLKSPPRADVAIFSLNGRLNLLQPFTRNRDLLREVIEKHTLIEPSYFSLSQFGDPHGPRPSDEAPFQNPDGSINYQLYGLQDFEAHYRTLETYTRVTTTIDKLSELARYLSGIPGRKNVIWFSRGFPLTLEPGVDGVEENKPSRNSGAVRFDSYYNFGPMVERLAQLFADSQIALYPINASGLTVSMMQASQSSRGAGRQENNVRANTTSARTDSMNEQQTIFAMEELAYQTGGHAFFNTNGLQEAARKVIETGSSYYTLTYVPEDREERNTFHAIGVTIPSGKYNVAYRRGYYTVPPIHSTPDHPSESLVTAMKSGFLPATQIGFKARALRDTTTSSPDRRRYLIDFAVNPADVSFSQSAAGRSAHMEFMLILYDSSGKPLDSSNRVVNLHLTDAQYAEARKGGLRLRHQIAVPATGKFSIRLGVYDSDADRIGSAEVWLSADK